MSNGASTYFATLTIRGLKADGTVTTSNLSGSYTVAGRNAERGLFEMLLKHLLANSPIVTPRDRVEIINWNASLTEGNTR